MKQKLISAFKVVEKVFYACTTVTLITMMCCMDSESNIPTITILACGAILFIGVGIHWDRFYRWYKGETRHEI